MCNKNLYSLLGLVSRARKLVTGDSLLKGIRANKVKCVIIANDASDNAKKKFSDKCKYYHVPYYIIGDVDSLSKAIGKNNRVCVGICDEGFAVKVKSMIGG
ncbi:ribosomal L7Ae/L30e/S12e/Gadd45 family protein [uncultured Limosilactobacillus sp.]|jgi:Ribosomal protein HS6-type (S12/L30/L7a)|uniref:L7Ae/L30e/S12e/Gadd45 family ribosomal protein n=1 Tax=uncultured Limosilactobacillus sp. TaxID=2837629 RepID=UPI00261778EE|nr:ribosomal L7Ae/L30e/S12e/Gadd45 family protein [uncultured Limosilactobacillus sp.]